MLRMNWVDGEGGHLPRRNLVPEAGQDLCPTLNGVSDTTVRFDPTA